MNQFIFLLKTKHNIKLLLYYIQKWINQTILNYLFEKKMYILL